MNSDQLQSTHIKQQNAATHFCQHLVFLFMEKCSTLQSSSIFCILPALPDWHYGCCFDLNELLHKLAEDGCISSFFCVFSNIIVCVCVLFLE